MSRHRQAQAITRVLRYGANGHPPEDDDAEELRRLRIPAPLVDQTLALARTAAEAHDPQVVRTWTIGNRAGDRLAETVVDQLDAGREDNSGDSATANAVLARERTGARGPTNATSIDDKPRVPWRQ